MYSISHAIAAADAAHAVVRKGLKSDSKVRTDAEAHEARVAKAKAMHHLESSMSLVQSALSKLDAKVVSRCNKPQHAQLGITNKPLLKRPINRRAVKTMGLGLRDAGDSPVASIINTMSANAGTTQKPTMASTVPTLQQMAKNVEPIITNFDSVLTKPYLDQFNASLNTVPVVGLKDQTIMYLGTTLNKNPLAPPVDAWAVFSQLPSGVTVGPDDNVHFFPFNADFYMSIGQKVWMKAHLPATPAGSQPDAALQKAVDNWPSLYNETWQYIGDTALPAADIKNIVPFSVFSADRSQIAFHLALLNSDGTLQYLDADVLQGSNNKWAQLNFSASNNNNTPPKWTSMAYWNNRIVGLDDSQNFWDMTPNWTSGTYTIDSQYKVPQAITELTATEQGPVGVRADGTLWKRILNPPKDGQDDGSYAWSSWIKQNGVTHLGVASPGVMLDLRLLTSTLRSRYIETQTAIAPLMNKMRAYGTTHAFFLKNLKKASDDWNNADTDDKQTLAIKNGKSFVVHAKTWAKILGVAASNAQQPINIMTNQLTDVEKQLRVQLNMLNDRLKTLQTQLQSQKEYLDHLQAAFWGSIAALLLSVVVAIVGVALANPYIIVAAGALFVAGLTCAIVFGKKVSEAAAAVASTQNQIDTTTTAISELTTVVDSFSSLSDLYGTLNMFFGRMTLDASALQDMDDATADQLGSDVLADPSSIDAAASMTDEMVAACSTYLDTLSKQGINLPTNNTLASLRTDDVHPSVALGLKSHTLNNKFQHTIDQANQHLIKGNTHQYVKLMDLAATVNDQSVSAQQLSGVATGLWFDAPALNNAGSIWNGYNKGMGISGQFALSLAENVTKQADTIGGRLDDVRPQIVQMVQHTLQLAETAKAWADKYPTLPDASNMQQAEDYQTNAVNICQDAQNSAAAANNAFNDFNHDAQAFQQGLEQQIGSKNNDINTARASANAAMNNLSPPWYVYLGGGIGAAAWILSQQNDIRNDLNNKVNALNASIQDLQKLEQSGQSFNGSSLTWQTMVQQVSKNLFSVYEVLTNVQGQLMEDPNLYKQFISMEWDQLAQNSRNVLAILGVQSPANSLMALNRHATRGLQSLRLSSLGSGTTTTPDSTQLVSALSSGSKLGPQLSSQVKDCKAAFDQLDVLLGLPYMSDIVGYWNDEKTEKATLLDVTKNLKREYVSVISMQYDAIQQLYSLSILQGFRARNVQQKKLPMTVFVNSTLNSMKAALRTVQNANTQFANNSAEFNKTVALIQSNIDELEKRINALDTQIDAANKQLRDKVINEIADVVAIAFATGALMISIGVIGPATAAVMGLGAKLAATAAVIAASTKLVLDSLSIDDLVKLIAGLKTSKDNLQKSVDQLKSVQPFFKTVVKGVNGVTATVNDMAIGLQNINDDVTMWKEIALTQDDVQEIQQSWDGLRDDCLTWMDMVHSQGINPVTSSMN
ncbi:hypothetical protein ANO11243_090880 [Dothideomycetidae sp. 11243]|nr:hypothetical protein ANO11243_090880 [fungal sp. No.11243]